MKYFVYGQYKTVDGTYGQHKNAIIDDVNAGRIEFFNTVSSWLGNKTIAKFHVELQDENGARTNYYSVRM